MNNTQKNFKQKSLRNARGTAGAPPLHMQTGGVVPTVPPPSLGGFAQYVANGMKLPDYGASLPIPASAEAAQQELARSQPVAPVAPAAPVAGNQIQQIEQNRAGLRGAANYAGGTPFVEGPAGIDKVDAKLTRGEAVLPVETVQKMGGPQVVNELITSTTGVAPKVSLRDGAKYAGGYPGEDRVTPIRELIQAQNTSRAPAVGFDTTPAAKPPITLAPAGTNIPAQPAAPIPFNSAPAVGNMALEPTTPPPVRNSGLPLNRAEVDFRAQQADALKGNVSRAIEGFQSHGADASQLEGRANLQRNIASALKTVTPATAPAPTPVGVTAAALPPTGIPNNGAHIAPPPLENPAAAAPAKTAPAPAPTPIAPELATPAAGAAPKPGMMSRALGTVGDGATWLANKVLPESHQIGGGAKPVAAAPAVAPVATPVAPTPYQTTVLPQGAVSRATELGRHVGDAARQAKALGKAGYNAAGGGWGVLGGAAMVAPEAILNTDKRNFLDSDKVPWQDKARTTVSDGIKYGSTAVGTVLGGGAGTALGPLGTVAGGVVGGAAGLAVGGKAAKGADYLLRKAGLGTDKPISELAQSMPAPVAAAATAPTGAKADTKGMTGQQIAEQAVKDALAKGDMEGAMKAAELGVKLRGDAKAAPAAAAPAAAAKPTNHEQAAVLNANLKDALKHGDLNDQIAASRALKNFTALDANNVGREHAAATLANAQYNREVAMAKLGYDRDKDAAEGLDKHFDKQFFTMGGKDGKEKIPDVEKNARYKNFVESTLANKGLDFGKMKPTEQKAALTQYRDLFELAQAGEAAGGVQLDTAGAATISDGDDSAGITDAMSTTPGSPTLGNKMFGWKLSGGNEWVKVGANTVRKHQVRGDNGGVDSSRLKLLDEALNDSRMKLRGEAK